MNKIDQEKPFSCSIVIPVYNEGDEINMLISQLQKIPCELIIVDGHPDKTTLTTIENKNIIKISSSQGRGIQLNAGAEKATNDVIWFLHADSQPSPLCLSNIKQSLQDQRIVAGAFRIQLNSSKKRYRFLERCINLRTQITKIPYGDQGIFIRKEFFDSLGGFQSIPLMEDLELMRRVKKQGGSIILLTEKIRTSPRRWEQEGFLRCTFRNWMVRMLYYLGVHPNTLVKWYKSNK